MAYASQRRLELAATLIEHRSALWTEMALPQLSLQSLRPVFILATAPFRGNFHGVATGFPLTLSASTRIDLGHSSFCHCQMLNGALRELEYALDTLKPDGTVLLFNVGGNYLAIGGLLK